MESSDKFSLALNSSHQEHRTLFKNVTKVAVETFEYFPVNDTSNDASVTSPSLEVSDILQQINSTIESVTDCENSKDSIEIEKKPPQFDYYNLTYGMEFPINEALLFSNESLTPEESRKDCAASKDPAEIAECKEKDCSEYGFSQKVELGKHNYSDIERDPSSKLFKNSEEKMYVSSVQNFSTVEQPFKNTHDDNLKSCSCEESKCRKNGSEKKINENTANKLYEKHKLATEIEYNTKPLQENSSEEKKECLDKSTQGLTTLKNTMEVVDKSNKNELLRKEQPQKTAPICQEKLNPAGENSSKKGQDKSKHSSNKSINSAEKVFKASKIELAKNEHSPIITTISEGETFKDNSKIERDKNRDKKSKISSHKGPQSSIKKLVKNEQSQITATKSKVKLKAVEENSSKEREKCQIKARKLLNESNDTDGTGSEKGLSKDKQSQNTTTESKEKLKVKKRDSSAERKTNQVKSKHPLNKSKNNDTKVTKSCEHELLNHEQLQTDETKSEAKLKVIKKDTSENREECQDKFGQLLKMADEKVSKISKHELLKSKQSLKIAVKSKEKLRHLKEDSKKEKACQGKPKYFFKKSKNTDEKALKSSKDKMLNNKRSKETATKSEEELKDLKEVSHKEKVFQDKSKHSLKKSKNSDEVSKSSNEELLKNEIWQKGSTKAKEKLKDIKEGSNNEPKVTISESKLLNDKDQYEKQLAKPEIASDKMFKSKKKLLVKVDHLQKVKTKIKQKLKSSLENETLLLKDYLIKPCKIVLEKIDCSKYGIIDMNFTTITGSPRNTLEVMEKSSSKQKVKNDDKSKKKLEKSKFKDLKIKASKSNKIIYDKSECLPRNQNVINKETFNSRKRKFRDEETSMECSKKYVAEGQEHSTSKRNKKLKNENAKSCKDTVKSQSEQVPKKLKNNEEEKFEDGQRECSSGKHHQNVIDKSEKKKDDEQTILGEGRKITKGTPEDSDHKQSTNVHTENVTNNPSDKLKNDITNANECGQDQSKEPSTKAKIFNDEISMDFEKEHCKKSFSELNSSIQELPDTLFYDNLSNVVDNILASSALNDSINSELAVSVASSSLEATKALHQNCLTKKSSSKSENGIELSVEIETNAPQLDCFNQTYGMEFPISDTLLSSNKSPTLEETRKDSEIAKGPAEVVESNNKNCKELSTNIKNVSKPSEENASNKEKECLDTSRHRSKNKLKNNIEAFTEICKKELSKSEHTKKDAIKSKEKFKSSEEISCKDKKEDQDTLKQLSREKMKVIEENANKETEECPGKDIKLLNKSKDTDENGSKKGLLKNEQPHDTATKSKEKLKVKKKLKDCSYKIKKAGEDDSKHSNDRAHSKEHLPKSDITKNKMSVCTETIWVKEEHPQFKKTKNKEKCMSTLENGLLVPECYQVKPCRIVLEKCDLSKYEVTDFNLTTITDYPSNTSKVFEKSSSKQKVKQDESKEKLNTIKKKDLEVKVSKNRNTIYDKSECIHKHRKFIEKEDLESRKENFSETSSDVARQFSNSSKSCEEETSEYDKKEYAAEVQEQNAGQGEEKFKNEKVISCKDINRSQMNHELSEDIDMEDSRTGYSIEDSANEESRSVEKLHKFEIARNSEKLLVEEDQLEKKKTKDKLKSTLGNGVFNVEGYQLKPCRIVLEKCDCSKYEVIDLIFTTITNSPDNTLDVLKNSSSKQKVNHDDKSKKNSVEQKKIKLKGTKIKASKCSKIECDKNKPLLKYQKQTSKGRKRIFSEQKTEKEMSEGRQNEHSREQSQNVKCKPDKNLQNEQTNLAEVKEIFDEIPEVSDQKESTNKLTLNVTNKPRKKLKNEQISVIESMKMYQNQSTQKETKSKITNDEIFENLEKEHCEKSFLTLNSSIQEQVLSEELYNDLSVVVDDILALNDYIPSEHVVSLASSSLEAIDAFQQRSSTTKSSSNCGNSIERSTEIEKNTLMEFSISDTILTSNEISISEETRKDSEIAKGPGEIAECNNKNCSEQKMDQEFGLGKYNTSEVEMEKMGKNSQTFKESKKKIYVSSVKESSLAKHPVETTNNDYLKSCSNKDDQEKPREQLTLNNNADKKVYEGFNKEPFTYEERKKLSTNIKDKLKPSEENKSDKKKECPHVYRQLSNKSKGTIEAVNKSSEKELSISEQPQKTAIKSKEKLKTPEKNSSNEKKEDQDKLKLLSNKFKYIAEKFSESGKKKMLKNEQPQKTAIKSKEKLKTPEENSSNEKKEVQDKLKLLSDECKYIAEKLTGSSKKKMLKNEQLQSTSTKSKKNLKVEVENASGKREKCPGKARELLNKSSGSKKDPLKNDQPKKTATKSKEILNVIKNDSNKENKMDQGDSKCSNEERHSEIQLPKSDIAMTKMSVSSETIWVKEEHLQDVNTKNKEKYINTSENESLSSEGYQLKTCRIVLEKNDFSAYKVIDLNSTSTIDSASNTSKVLKKSCSKQTARQDNESNEKLKKLKRKHDVRISASKSNKKMYDKNECFPKCRKKKFSVERSKDEENLSVEQLPKFTMARDNISNDCEMLAQQDRPQKGINNHQLKSCLENKTLTLEGYQLKPCRIVLEKCDYSKYNVIDLNFISITDSPSNTLDVFEKSSPKQKANHNKFKRNSDKSQKIKLRDGNLKSSKRSKIISDKNECYITYQKVINKKTLKSQKRSFSDEGTCMDSNKEYASAGCKQVKKLKKDKVNSGKDVNRFQSQQIFSKLKTTEEEMSKNVQKEHSLSEQNQTVIFKPDKSLQNKLTNPSGRKAEEHEKMCKDLSKQPPLESKITQELYGSSDIKDFTDNPNDQIIANTPYDKLENDHENSSKGGEACKGHSEQSLMQSQTIQKIPNDNDMEGSIDKLCKKVARKPCEKSGNQQTYASDSREVYDNQHKQPLIESKITQKLSEDSNTDNSTTEPNDCNVTNTLSENSKADQTNPREVDKEHSEQPLPQSHRNQELLEDSDMESSDKLCKIITNTSSEKSENQQKNASDSKNLYEDQFQQPSFESKITQDLSEESDLCDSSYEPNDCIVTNTPSEVKTDQTNPSSVMEVDKEHSEQPLSQSPMNQELLEDSDMKSSDKLSKKIANVSSEKSENQQRNASDSNASNEMHKDQNEDALVSKLEETFENNSLTDIDKKNFFPNIDECIKSLCEELISCTLKRETNYLCQKNTCRVILKKIDSSFSKYNIDVSKLHSDICESDSIVNPDHVRKKQKISENWPDNSDINSNDSKNSTSCKDTNYIKQSEILETLISQKLSNCQIIPHLSCKLCEKTFKTHNLFIEHNIKCHKVSAFKCNLCGKSFQKRFKFMNHMKSLHPESQPYVCEYSKCKKSFSTLKEVRDHHKYHWRFVCKYCKKGFIKKCFMHKHVLKFHLI